MYWDVKFVKPLSDYRIYVELENGRQGIFDVKPYLDHGVFRELRDVHYFGQVGIQFGAVTWPNEQDIAPETLLAEMLPGEPLEPSAQKHIDAGGWEATGRTWKLIQRLSDHPRNTHQPPDVRGWTANARSKRNR